jgi:hypothetical protein
MGFIKAVAQCRAVQMLETLIETLHFLLPFAFGNQGLGADR